MRTLICWLTDKLTIASAIKSTPFCLDQRPTNANRSLRGSSSNFAHLCTSALFAGLIASATLFIETFTVDGKLSSAAMSEGSKYGNVSWMARVSAIPSLRPPGLPGLGKASIYLRVHSAGYLAHDRLPYFSDTPATPAER